MSKINEDGKRVCVCGTEMEVVEDKYRGFSIECPNDDGEGDDLHDYNDPNDFFYVGLDWDGYRHSPELVFKTKAERVAYIRKFNKEQEWK